MHHLNPGPVPWLAHYEALNPLPAWPPQDEEPQDQQPRPHVFPPPLFSRDWNLCYPSGVGYSEPIGNQWQGVGYSAPIRRRQPLCEQYLHPDWQWERRWFGRKYFDVYDEDFDDIDDYFVDADIITDDNDITDETPSLTYSTRASTDVANNTTATATTTP